MRRVVPLLCLLALAGCGSVADAELPAAATPVPSPPLTERPAGTVTGADGDALGRSEPDVRRVEPDGRETRLSPDELAALATTTAAADGGRTTLTLDPRAREVTATGDAEGTVGAGFGPVQIVSTGEGSAYVTDAVADGLVVLRTQPELAVTRRVGFPGAGPWAMAFDPETYRLYVTLTATNEVAEVQAGTRPFERERYPSLRAPMGIAVQDGEVVVTNAAGEVQRFRPDD